ncbi:UDP-glucuronosyltransferase 2B9-like isoform X1 [Anopheles arabiensis]|uniref:UDP-glucuronosyltransferase 2B9-like isoform X1 n=1 Tax=Anopheles arabiensis TaxID=7173 RepID=UPI001AAD07E1|nr:UDP-glucuronosyltransferase 2B9-like isoform X1 [Anopheles arabiensis]
MNNVSQLPIVFIIFLIMLLVISIRGTNLSNILYISAVASPSHFLWSQQFSSILASNGHNVTLLNIYKEGKQNNLHFLKLDGVDNALSLDHSVDYLALHSMSPLELLFSFFELEYMVCEHSIASKQFLKLLNYPKHFTFNLIIHDHLAGPCLLLLLKRFNFPPLIMASASNILSSVECIMGSLTYPGFIPSSLRDPPETFGYLDRIYNYMLTTYEFLFKRYYSDPRIDSLIQSRFQNITSVSRLESTAVVVLMNSITLLETPEPQIWRVVNVGGLHITAPKMLPEFLYQHANRTYEKCVLISFGSNLKLDSLNNFIAQTIITVAQLLPNFIFLWKVDIQKPAIEGLIPENVITSDWFPQNDILGSGMVDVLFTHGGLLTIQEAMWHGIPMLGTPNYGDQYQNVHRIEKLGIGKKLYLEELNPVSLKGNLLGIIHNERYKQRATAIAKTIRDEQITPQRKALWTVEWVLRNYGTIQLLDDLNEVGYIEKNSLDVLSTLIIISICINFLLFRIIQVCVSFMTARVVRKNKMKKTP